MAVSRQLVNIAAIVGISAIAACSSSDLADDKKTPALVRLGMSPRQVATLVGSPFDFCWIYKNDQQVCFAEEMVNLYGLLRDDGDKLEINMVAAGDWPPRPPAKDSKNVAIGMSTGQVSAIMGAPQSISRRYSVGPGIWYGVFVGDRLAEFKYLPPSPIS